MPHTFFNANGDAASGSNPDLSSSPSKKRAQPNGVVDTPEASTSSPTRTPLAKRKRGPEEPISHLNGASSKAPNGFMSTPLGSGLRAAPGTSGWNNKLNGLGKIPKKDKGSISNLNGTTGVSAKELAEIKKHRQDLPIYLGRDAIVNEVKSNDTVIILGETGSGKTTQVPQYLHEASFSQNGIIGITQTRRVAATSLAARISYEQSTPLGSLVGYSVRFDELSSPHTKIKFLTDGMLVRDLLSDPLLGAYSVVVVDEAHERSLRTDVLMSRLKDIQRVRNGNVNGKGKGKGKPLKPLKVLIMSATLDAEKFSRFFNNAKILYVQGRQHPVKMLYTPTPQTDYLDAALRTFFQIHHERRQESGDVLVFLPGQEDIENLANLISELAPQLPHSVLKVQATPLYSALPPSAQTAVFKPPPPGTRKCILATNIAETAITIPGVRYVIDTGTFKEKNWTSGKNSGVESLITRPISKASALQRAGRAGREGPGYCYRLYTEETYTTMKESSPPEIQRSNLASITLQLKCLGVDPETIDWMDAPSKESFGAAFIALFAISALDSTFKLTPLGHQMALFPVEPAYARSLLASKEHRCTSEVMDIVSVLSAASAGSVFHDPSDKREEALEARGLFRHHTGDHMMFLNVLRAYEALADLEQTEAKLKKSRSEWCRAHFLNERTIAEALKIRMQLTQSCERAGIDCTTSCGQDVDGVLRSLVAGMPHHAAQIFPEGGYRAFWGSGQVKIHPSSSMVDKKVPAIMYNELIFTTQLYARCVSSVPKHFITELPIFSQKGS